MENLKNLLVYIGSNQRFSEECDVLAKIQIDNSLELGWDVKDLLMVTNFPYEYRGVKAIQVGDEHFYKDRPRSIKTAIIPFLIESGIIQPNTIYWNHDFDAYQMAPVTAEELGLEGLDVGFTDYGWKKRLCLGSYFFKDTSKHIFEVTRDVIYKNVEDEDAVETALKDPEAKFKVLNVTYNFGMRNVGFNWNIATKPIKVTHFHMEYKWVQTQEIFVKGNNELGFPLVTDRFIKILDRHGVLK